MKKIKLTQGKFALVDDEDFEELNQHKWCVQKTARNYYAKRQTRDKNGKQKTIYMHRQILDAPPGKEVDHKNANGLDNRKENIRVATRRQNHANRIGIGGKSKYKGVCLNKSPYKAKYWAATIRGPEGNKITLGTFPYTAEGELEAAMAYNRAARKYFGEFARVNPVYRVITHGSRWLIVLDPRISISV